MFQEIKEEEVKEKTSETRSMHKIYAIDYSLILVTLFQIGNGDFTIATV